MNRKFKRTAFIGNVFTVISDPINKNTNSF